MDELNSRGASGEEARRIHYWPLDASDAESIGVLQGRLFPAELTEPVEEIRQILANTEQHLVCNFSFGAYLGTRMVGYVFAYVESTSLFHQRDEEVLYIKEVAVLPGYEQQLRVMFQKLLRQWAAFTPHLPMEAHAVTEALAKWRRLERMFGRQAITLSTREEPPRAGKPAYHLLRFDLAAGSASLSELPSTLPAAQLHAGVVAVSVVTEPRQWLALRDEWDVLLRRTPGATVLQSFDYLWRWWKYCGIWNDLRILVLRRAEAIIGIAPLMIEHDAVPTGVERRLAFIGAPAAVSLPRLLFGGDGALCLPALLAWLDTSAGDRDLLVLDEQDDAGLITELRAHARTRGHEVQEHVLQLAHVDMPTSAVAEPALSPRLRLRRVDRMPALVEALDAYGELEVREPAAGTPFGILDDRDAYFFYQNLAEHYGTRGRFVLEVLEQDGRAMASSFGLADGQQFHTLKFACRADADRHMLAEALGELELPRLQARGHARHTFTGEIPEGWPRRLVVKQAVTTLRVLQPRVLRGGLVGRVLGWFRGGSD